MNLVSDSIKCNQCKLTLKLPVVLPCGDSICKHHIDMKNECKTIECVLCNEVFDIPTTGFVRNKSLEKLLEKQINKIDLGDEYNSAFRKCQQFNEFFEHLKRIKNDPETKIHTVISELRNDVDLRREELKQDVDNEALKIIEKLDEFEKECKASIKSDSKSDSKLEEKLKIWEKKVNEWKGDLNTFERNTYKWSIILSQSTSEIKDLQSELIKFNESLFLNRLNEFNWLHLSFSNSSFFVISKEINKLSKYLETEEKITIEHKMKAVGIEWRLKVVIKDNKFGFFLSSRPTTKIKVEYDFVILDQLGMDESYTRSSICEFDSSGIGYGYKCILDLEDIIPNYNLYNIEKDSCIVQAIIKKIEWL